MAQPQLKTVEQPQDQRISISAEARRLAASFQGRTTRVSGFFGRNWATRANVDQAKEDLLLIAEEALAMRRSLD